MRKRTTFFMILLCLHAALQIQAKNPSNGPESKAGMELPCNLQAPGSVAWSFPTSTSVLVSWTPVLGAWGYYATLTGPSGIQFASTQGTSTVFTVAPNNVYTFRVFSKCDQLSQSPLFLEAKISTYIVISDILYNGQPCLSLDPIRVAGAVPTFNIEFAYDPTLSYYLRFTKSNVNYDIHFYKESLQNPPAPPLPDFKYKMEQVPPAPNGPNVSFTCNGGGQSGCVKMRLDVGQGQTISDIEMYHLVQASAMEQILISGNTFDACGLYNCTRYFKSGGDTRDDDITPTSLSYVVSPFHDYLQIGLDPSKRLKSVRIMDISGRLAFSQTMPDDIEFSEQLILPTEQLAQGLYILQLQSNDGKVETFKVVKD